MNYFNGLSLSATCMMGCTTVNGLQKGNDSEENKYVFLISGVQKYYHVNVQSQLIGGFVFMKRIFRLKINNIVLTIT